MVRTSGPALPSGRRAASTGQSVPSPVLAEQARIMPVASLVAASARCLVDPLGRLGDEDDVDVRRRS